MSFILFLRPFFLLLSLTLLSAPLVCAEIVVNSVSELVDAVNNTQNGGDRTILIADGTYSLNGNYLRIVVDDVTVRSQSGNRENVILDGNYQTTEIFQIVASNVTVADLTLMRAQDHPIHVMGGSSSDVENTLINNVHIIDPGEQAIKINTSGDYTTTRGTIQNSLIELTASGRDFVENDTSNGYPCYTGGVDAHTAHDWTIQDNEIRGFWCATGLSEHGVHFWSDSSNTLVQRNLIVDCDRGVGFGLGSSGHSGGIIRNNMIYHGPDHGYSDVGISLESATGTQVYNNTIFHEHSYPNGIEYRFAESNTLTIVNNLTNRAISSRDGGSTLLLSNNVTSALAVWFTDAAKGDLHLRSERSGVTGAARTVSGLVDDFDKQNRPQGTGLDIGADEYSLVVPEKPPTLQNGRATLSWLLLLIGGKP
jgi:parallel beta helix pectate lyase-like protein